VFFVSSIVQLLCGFPSCNQSAMDGATGGPGFSTGQLLPWSRPQSGDLLTSDLTLTEAARLKEAKDFSGLPSKQAEWEKQMESADAKQAELFQFQWKLVREQLSTLSRELGTSRQEFEALRNSAARREARDTEMTRFLQLCQASVEKESLSRRSQEEEFTRTINQLKSTIEQEKTERMRALQSLEGEVRLQNTSVKQQQNMQTEEIKSLGSRSESWCLELRAMIDKEICSCNSKVDELQRELSTVGQGFTQLSKSLGAEKNEREKLISSVEDQVSQLRLGFQSKDEEDRRQFAENREEVKSVRQFLEKEGRERGVLEKVLQEALEALHLEKTESRARHNSLLGQMQAEHNKLQSNHQTLDARLEEHREISAQARAEDGQALEAFLKKSDFFGLEEQFMTHKEQHQSQMTDLRAHSTDSLESLEALLRREFKDQFEKIKEQLGARETEIKRLQEAFDSKFGKRYMVSRGNSGVSRATTPTTSVNAPSTVVTQITTTSGPTDLNGSFQRLNFKMSSPASAASLRTSSPSPVQPGSRSTTPVPSPSSPTARAAPAIVPMTMPMTSKSPIREIRRTGSPTMMLTGSIKGPMTTSQSLTATQQAPVSPVSLSSNRGVAAPVSPPMPLPGQTRQEAMAKAVADSAKNSDVDSCSCATPGCLPSPALSMRPMVQVSSTRVLPTATSVGAYAFRG